MLRRHFQGGIARLPNSCWTIESWVQLWLSLPLIPGWRQSWWWLQWRWRQGWWTAFAKSFRTSFLCSKKLPLVLILHTSNPSVVTYFTFSLTYNFSYHIHQENVLFTFLLSMLFSPKKGWDGIIWVTCNKNVRKHELAIISDKENVVVKGAIKTQFIYLWMCS